MAKPTALLERQSESNVLTNVPLSLAERARRYELVRKEMDERDIDVLVVVGRDASSERGHHRYLTAYPIVAGFAHYVVFPRSRDVEPVYFSGSSPSGVLGVASGWVTDLRTNRLPADEIVAEVGRLRGSGKIGIMDTVPIPIYRALAAKHGETAIVDAAECLLKPRWLKSDEEIACLRKSADAANVAFEAMKKAVRPGVTDFQLYGELHKVIHEAGCEYSMDIIDCNTGNAATAPVGAVVKEDTVVQIEISPAWAGYYTQLRVAIPVEQGVWPGEWANLRAAWEQGYDAMRKVLKPGSRSCDVYDAAAAAVKAAGYESKRRAGHGLGLQIDEFSVDPDNQTMLEPGMCLCVHVPVSPKDDPTWLMMVGSTFLVTEDGYEELNSP